MDPRRAAGAASRASADADLDTHYRVSDVTVEVASRRGSMVKPVSKPRPRPAMTAVAVDSSADLLDEPASPPPAASPAGATAPTVIRVLIIAMNKKVGRLRVGPRPRAGCTAPDSRRHPAHVSDVCAGCCLPASCPAGPIAQHTCSLGRESAASSPREQLAAAPLPPHSRALRLLGCRLLMLLNGCSQATPPLLSRPPAPAAWTPSHPGTHTTPSSHPYPCTRSSTRSPCATSWTGCGRTRS